MNHKSKTMISHGRKDVQAHLIRNINSAGMDCISSCQTEEFGSGHAVF